MHRTHVGGVEVLVCSLPVEHQVGTASVSPPPQSRPWPGSRPLPRKPWDPRRGSGRRGEGRETGEWSHDGAVDAIEKRDLLLRDAWVGLGLLDPVVATLSVLVAPGAGGGRVPGDVGPPAGPCRVESSLGPGLRNASAGASGGRRVLREGAVAAPCRAGLVSLAGPVEPWREANLVKEPPSCLLTPPRRVPSVPPPRFSGSPSTVPEVRSRLDRSR